MSGYHCHNSNLVAFSEDAKSESVTTLLTKFGATFPVEGRHGNRRPSLPASARLEIERRLETGERVTAGEIVRQAQEGHAVRTDASRVGESRRHSRAAATGPQIARF